MQWNEVRTAHQRDNLIRELLERVQRLQELAKQTGLLLELKLSPERTYCAGDIGSRDEWDLYLQPEGILMYKHYETWRAYDEWDSRNEAGVVETEKELTRFLQKCQVEVSRLEEIRLSLER